MSTFDDSFDNDSLQTTSPSMAMSAQKMVSDAQKKITGFFKNAGAPTMVGLVTLVLLVVYAVMLYVKIQRQKGENLAMTGANAMNLIMAVAAAVVVLTVTLSAQYMANIGHRYIAWVVLLSPFILGAVMALGLKLGVKVAQMALGRENYTPAVGDAVNYVFLNETPSSSIIYSNRNTDEARIRAGNLQPTNVAGAMF